MFLLLVANLIFGANANNEENYVYNNQQACIVTVPGEDVLYEDTMIELVIIDNETSDRVYRTLTWHHNKTWADQDSELREENEILRHSVDDTNFSWKMIFGDADTNNARELKRLSFYGNYPTYVAEYTEEAQMVTLPGTLKACYNILAPAADVKLPLAK